MSKLSENSPANKPVKPTPDFPLYAHASGRWAKKVNGRTLFFGKWEDPDSALENFKSQYATLYAGRVPDRPGVKLNVADLCSKFLNSRTEKLQAGALEQCTFNDYRDATDTVVEFFGKYTHVESLTPDDFSRLRKKLSKGVGPTTLGNAVTRIRVIFNHAMKAELIAGRVRFGDGFDKPRKAQVRAHRAEAKRRDGKKMFSPTEIHSLLQASSPVLHAMTMLGLNCGFNGADIGRVPYDVFDLETGWLVWYRKKTGIERKAKLWPETIAAVKAALPCRPKPKKSEHADRLFLTRIGQPWYKDDKPKQSALQTQFKELMEEAGVYRPRRGFLALRHTTETIAGDAKDQVCVDAIMGHVDNSIAEVYREHIADERFVAIADYMHAWLYGAKGGVQ
jgi:integrase